MERSSPTIGLHGALLAGAMFVACTGTRTTDNAAEGGLRTASAPPSVPASTGSAPPIGSGPIAPGKQNVLPPERVTLWNPGLNAVGGIPRVSAIFKTLTPSGADDTAAIQAALDTCPPNQVVQLEAGKFEISGTGLAIARSRVVLRGRGPDKTRLVRSKRGVNFPVVIIGKRWPKYTPPTAFAAGGKKGDLSITLTINPFIRPGELVIINQLTNEAITWWGPNAPPGSEARKWFIQPDRPIGQILEVAKVDGKTLTFTTPLHIDFPMSASPQLVRFANDPDGPPIDTVRYSGLEDLYVSGGEGGDGGGNVHLFASSYCWVRNIESDFSAGNSVNFEGTFRCVLRDSYIHSTRNPNPGGEGYGVGVNSYASDNLIENNAIWNFNKVDVFRASGGGNVFGYNYLEDGYGAGYKTIVEVGLNASHYTTPHYELFEGNQAFNFDSDSYWGNSIYITVFRNHFTGRRRSVPPLTLTDEMNHRVIGLTIHHHHYNFLGNVLGTEGQSPTPGKVLVFEKNDAFGDWSRVPMWQLGYDGSNWTPPQDARVVETTIRHGNFDYVTKQVAWDPRLPVRALPPSLYLASKPEFLGDVPWPVVDPERTPKVAVLPARKRFDSLH